MFRERRQMKNIITLCIVLAAMFLCLCLPVATLGLPQEFISIESSAPAVSSDIEAPVVESQEILMEETIYHTETTDSEVIEYPVDAQQKDYAVPSVDTNFKSFTYYTSLKESSFQGQLQKIAYTDENGLRKVENYYCAALGTYYSTTIGDLFRITTSDNNVFDIILCDVKANAHTDVNNMYTISDNSLVEFYVDKTTLNSAAKVRGSISAIEGFSGSIVKVEYLGYYEWK